MSLARVLTALGSLRFNEAYTQVDEARDFRTVFLENEAGLRVLMRIVDKGGWLHAMAPMTLSGVETPALMAFREGRRSLVADIVEAISADDPASEPEIIRD